MNTHTYTSAGFPALGKIGPYGPEPIWHFGTQLAKNTQLSLGGPLSKHMKFKWLREVKSMDFKKMLINFRNKGYSDIIPFVYEGKKEIHQYMQYEVSMTDCMGRIANQRKIPKWLPFRNYKSESLNI